MEPDPELITPAEIAKRLHVGRATVYGRLLNSASPDALPFHQIGRCKKVSRRAFERWLHGEGA